MLDRQVEQRATRRFSLRLPVLLKQSDKVDEIATETRDVSARGVCFYLDPSFAVGTNIEFVLTLPSDITRTESIRVKCFGRVVRTDPSLRSGSRIAVAAVIDRYEFLSDFDA